MIKGGLIKLKYTALLSIVVRGKKGGKKEEKSVVTWGLQKKVLVRQKKVGGGESDSYCRFQSKANQSCRLPFGYHGNHIFYICIYMLWVTFRRPCSSTWRKPTHSPENRFIFEKYIIQIVSQVC